MAKCQWEPVVQPCALVLAQDSTLCNSWLLGVGPGYLPFQYSASLGLAPSDGARAGSLTVSLLWTLGLAPSKGARVRDVSEAP